MIRLQLLRAMRLTAPADVSASVMPSDASLKDNCHLSPDSETEY